MTTINPAKAWRKYNKRYQLNQTAKLITWSKVFSGPTGFERQGHYFVAIVELPSGERITTQLADVDEAQLSHGLKLQATLRKISAAGADGIINYGVKFKAVDSKPISLNL